MGTLLATGELVRNERTARLGRTGRRSAARADREAALAKDMAIAEGCWYIAKGCKI